MYRQRSLPMLIAILTLLLLAASSLQAQQLQQSRATSSKVVRDVRPVRTTPNVRITGVVAWPAQHQGQPTSPNPCSKVNAALTEVKAPSGLGGQQPDQQVVAIPWGTNCRYTFGLYVPQNAVAKKYNVQTTYTGSWSKPATIVEGHVSGPSGVQLPISVEYPGPTVRTIMVDFQLAVSLLK